MRLPLYVIALSSFFVLTKGQACETFRGYYDPLDNVPNGGGRTGDMTTEQCSNRCTTTAGCTRWSHWDDGGCHIGVEASNLNFHAEDRMTSGSFCPPPTIAPTPHPTNAPTPHPTNAPTTHPTNAPTNAPTVSNGSLIASKWAISDPIAVYDSVSNTFTMTYSGTSDGIDGSNLHVSFYDKHCKYPAEGGALYAFTAANQGISDPTDLTTLPSPSIGSNFAQVLFKLDTTVLAKNNKIYTSPSADTENKGEMKVCARMSVGYGDGEDFTEVNFVETVFTIKYDLEADFDLSEFNVAPKAKDTSTGSKEYAVEAALCSGSVAPFNQGSLICVDVKPNDDSAKDGIVMKSIDSFEWKRDETTQPAITDSNVISDNKLTSITCDANSDKCSFNSVLFADFYESIGVVSGSGSATMMFKTDRRALMDGSASASGRSLQEAAAVAAATSEFDIAIPVGASDEDGVGALKTAGGASLFGFTSALASVIVIVVGLVSVSADLMA